MFTHVKDPISICPKKKNRPQRYTLGKNINESRLGIASPCQSQLASLEESDLNFPWGKFPWDNKVIKNNFVVEFWHGFFSHRKDLKSDFGTTMSFPLKVYNHDCE